MYQQSRGVGAGLPISAELVNLHLFFLRIMKEHSVFLEAGFSQKDKNLADQAAGFRKGFDNLLMQAIALADHIVSPKAMDSGQFVTPFTAQSERMTSFLTGIPIDSNITVSEKSMVPADGAPKLSGAEARISAVNDAARSMTAELRDFKKKILSDAVNCRIFTTNYPAELHHMYREAEHYLKMLDALEKNKNTSLKENLMSEEAFWNDIMAEHNKAAAGKLDPTEKDAIKQSRKFAKEFEELTSRAKIAQIQPEPREIVTRDSQKAVEALQDFQIDSMRGMLNCDIQSIIYPLRQDHHIRETYYYKWLMDMEDSIRP